MNQEVSYLTSDLPGIGGVIKQIPEDFFVEEQPLYQPTGTGEHLYLFVEKRLRSTSDVIRRLAAVFRVSRGEVGYAGLKDKRAVTRQYFSIRLPDASQDQAMLDTVSDAHMKVLSAARGENKLRRGHLAGNRFVIRIRQVKPDSVWQAGHILDRLVQAGVPNFVGHQRFGYRLVNHKIGRLLLLGHWQQMLDLMLGHPLESDHAPTRLARQAYEQGDYQTALQNLPHHLHQDRQAIDALRQGKGAQEAVAAIDRQQRAFFISAMQSAIFNRVLSQRLGNPDFPGIHRLIEGDLAWNHANRSVFAVDRATAQRENVDGGRLQSLEVSPSGPMWGLGMLRAGGIVGRCEQQALEDERLIETDLRGGPQGKANGDRRPMRAIIRGADISSGVDDVGSYIRVAFALPRGSFATVVLQEIMKTMPRDDQVRDGRPQRSVVG